MGQLMSAPLSVALVVAALIIVLPVGSAIAEIAAPNARDVATVQDCMKSQRGRDLKGERCIGVVVDPCLKRARSTADQNACADRELRVWDDILNETYRRLGQRLDDDQKAKARDMQRAWIENRDKTCAFYWDFFQGTMASPMSAYCNVRETARRAMFLISFMDEAEGR
jgi:uncharacterized protein YecT (DUF1311 family)